jgi:hypothetical protein
VQKSYEKDSSSITVEDERSKIYAMDNALCNLHNIKDVGRVILFRGALTLISIYFLLRLKGLHNTKFAFLDIAEVNNKPAEACDYPLLDSVPNVFDTAKEN